MTGPTLQQTLREEAMQFLVSGQAAGGVQEVCRRWCWLDVHALCSLLVTDATQSRGVPLSKYVGTGRTDPTSSNAKARPVALQPVGGHCQHSGVQAGIPRPVGGAGRPSAMRSTPLSPLQLPCRCVQLPCWWAGGRALSSECVPLTCACGNDVWQLFETLVEVMRRRPQLSVDAVKVSLALLLVLPLCGLLVLSFGLLPTPRIICSLKEAGGRPHLASPDACAPSRAHEGGTAESE